METTSKGIFIFILATGLILSCATDKSSVATQIDEIFAGFDKNAPGCAVVVIKDGEVVFKKSYGLANLEYEIPISTATVFNIASASKQFTAFCIALLESEGKLSFDDDIRKYLPDLPEYEKTVTIRHLLHHTSGLPDHSLIGLAGLQTDDVLTQGLILKLIKTQRNLASAPGEKFVYINTDYTLLAAIVEKVSGQSFKEFTKQNIFAPLDMINSHFHDDYEEIIKNRAYSYQVIDTSKYSNYWSNQSWYGAFGLYTSADDLIKWFLNFDDPKVGNADVIKQIYECGVLNNGQQLNYAFGLQIDNHKGFKRIGHGGITAGYSAYTFRYPDQNLGIILLANSNDFNPDAIADKIAAMLLPAAVQTSDNKIPRTDTSLHKYYEGSYLGAGGKIFEILSDSGKLYAVFDKREQLLPITDSSFSLYGFSTLIFSKPTSGESTKMRQLTDNGEFEYVRFIRRDFMPDKLHEFAGMYLNIELGTLFTIVIEGDKLIVKHSRINEIELTHIVADTFSGSNWRIESLVFERDKDQNVTGFKIINTNRTAILSFDRIK